METEKIEKFIKSMKKNMSRKSFLAPFLASALLLIVLAGIAFGAALHFRADIFGYFAREYLAEMQDPSAGNGAPERVLEKQTIFTQEHFVVDAVKKTNPAVVSIIITKEVPKYELYLNPNFNVNIPQYRQNGTEKKEVGGGSGFFVSKEGLILTNRHVVDRKDVEYTVYTNDGKKHPAAVVDLDPVLDVAIMKIEGGEFPYLALGDSDALEVGQSVIAIGNALAEFRNTVSVGVVSGLSRSITAGTRGGGSENLEHVIQTDAAINPGNSGGPLLDLSGKVVGVNVAVAEGSQNIGFALPINSVKGAIESVKLSGKIIRPYLGIRYVQINTEVKEKNNLTVDYGVLIRGGQNQDELAVAPGSPADRAGLVENDIILQVDGVKLDGETSFASIIRQKKVGQAITMKVLHQGVEKIVNATLAEAGD